MVVLLSGCQPGAKEVSEITPASSDSVQADGTASAPSPDQESEISSEKSFAIDSTQGQIDKEDPSRLRVLKWRLAKLRNARDEWLLLSVDVTKETAYIEYEMCPLKDTGMGELCEEKKQENPEEYEDVKCAPGGRCIRGTSDLLNVTFPSLQAGRVKISVKACLNAEAALSGTTNLCSPANENIENTYSFDQEIADLYFDYEVIKTRLIELAAEYKSSLKKFSQDATKCDISNQESMQFLQSKVDLANKISSIPEQVLTGAIDPLFGQGSAEQWGKKAKSSMTGVVDVIQDGCEEVGESTFTALCSISKLVFGDLLLGQFVLFNPSATVGEQVHNIKNVIAAERGEADKLVPKKCTALNAFLLRKEAFNIENAALIQEYREIKSSLREAGYVDYVPIEQD